MLLKNSEWGGYEILGFVQHFHDKSNYWLNVTVIFFPFPHSLIIASVASSITFLDIMSKLREEQGLFHQKFPFRLTG